MKKIIQTVLSLGGIAYILFLFARSFDGEVGAILIVFMLTAPLISLIFAIAARNRVKFSIKCDAYVNKGSELKVTVKVERTGAFPLSVIDIVPGASEVFEKQNKTYRLSMFSGNSREFTFKVRAKTGGNGSIYVAQAYSCGFLGFLRLRIKSRFPEPVLVGVVPDIPDIKASSQLFRSIADVVLTSDDEEDNDTAMLFSANTAPGYEHREYVEGDPLKRINWKLSSKKSKLMVRLDEAASAVQPMIIFDLYRKKDAAAEYAVLTEEKLLRAVFGLLTALVKQGIACNFVYYGSSGEVMNESVDNPDYPSQLLLKVLAVKVTEDRRIDPAMLGTDVCACLIATTDAGEGISALTDKIADLQNASILGVSAESSNSTGLPLWYLDEDDNFRMV